ncbi:MAG: bifunctional methylenetetrahydrofolate dehydrogenase/methenyltetrahydrofolate cyclohydrolase, partial [Candidatus Pacebacteria bacterium CG10_big_fil_rev_8_21_14_0_10_45_6]
MAQIIDGKGIAKKIHTKTAHKVASLKAKNITVKLAVILVGDDKASALYVKKKGQAAKRVGMAFELHEYPASIAYNELQQEITKIQADPILSGLIIQLPVPENFYPHILDVVDPRVDVDCLTHYNLGKLVMGTHSIMPPTPGAVLSVLDDIEIDLKGKKITIVGAGVLVGKPLSIALMNKEATVTICNEFTPD